MWPRVPLQTTERAITPFRHMDIWTCREQQQRFLRPWVWQRHCQWSTAFDTDCGASSTSPVTVSHFSWRSSNRSSSSSSSLNLSTLLRLLDLTRDVQRIVGTTQLGVGTFNVPMRVPPWVRRNTNLAWSSCWSFCSPLLAVHTTTIPSSSFACRSTTDLKALRAHKLRRVGHWLVPYDRFIHAPALHVVGPGALPLK